MVGKREAENQSSPAAAEVTIRGNITNDDLKGPLKGMNVSDLVKFLQNGSAYLEADTPKFPVGAIRGQIASGFLLWLLVTLATPEGGNTTSMGESPASTSEKRQFYGDECCDNSTTMMANRNYFTS